MPALTVVLLTGRAVLGGASRETEWKITEVAPKGSCFIDPCAGPNQAAEKRLSVITLSKTKGLTRHIYKAM